MKTYVVTIQKPHGPNANPVNHRSKWIASAETPEAAARNVSAQLYRLVGAAVLDVSELPAGSVICIVS